MRKALVALLVFGLLGLLGLLVAIVPARATADRLAMSGFPDSIVAVASYRGQAADPSGTLSSAAAYMPIDARETDVVLYVQNEAASGGSIGITFYDLNGSVVHQISDPISGHGSLAYELAGIASLPSGFAGSTVVTGTRSTHALVNGQPLVVGGLFSYSGVPTGTKEIILPNVFREYYGYNSTILVQNVRDAQATITVTYHPFPEGNSYVDNDTIPARGTALYDQQGIPDLGTRFAGWAHVESDQPLVVVVQILNAVTGQTAACNGLTDEDADNGFLVPYQYKDTTSGRSSSVTVSNLAQQTAAITTTWRTGDGSEVWSGSRTGIPFGQPESYFAVAIGTLPDGLDGALWGITDRPVATTNALNVPLAGNDGFAMTQGTALADAKPTVYLPRMARVLDKGWDTAFSVQNASDIAATVAMTFYHHSGSVTAVVNDGIAGYGFKRFTSTDIPSLGDDWEGSVVIQASQPVGVEVLQFLTGSPDIAVSPDSLSTDLVQDGTISLPLTVANSGDGDLIWSLVEVPSVGWLDAIPAGGTVPSQGHTEVAVSMDATGMAEGVYTTTLQITSDDPDTPRVDVPVTMTLVEGYGAYLPLALREWPTPTPIPTPCTLARVGQWTGDASFIVPADQSRVLDFQIEIDTSLCGNWVLTDPEVPITDCGIEFAGSSGGVLIWGDGTFDTETAMSGSFTVFTGSSMCLGYWSSSWTSSP